MSINRFLATITIALAGFGTACSQNVVERLDAPVSATDSAPADEGEQAAMELFATLFEAAGSGELDSEELGEELFGAMFGEDALFDQMVDGAEIQWDDDSIDWDTADDATDDWDEWDDEWDDDWVSEIIDEELAELRGPWGADGDHSCTVALSHLESTGAAPGWSVGTSDGVFADASLNLTAFFAGTAEASQVMAELGQCEATRQANQLGAARRAPNPELALVEVAEEAGDGWALRVFEDIGAGVVVVFAHEFDQVSVSASSGLDRATAIEETYWMFGYN